MIVKSWRGISRTSFQNEKYQKNRPRTSSYSQTHTQTQTYNRAGPTHMRIEWDVHSVLVRTWVEFQIQHFRIKCLFHLWRDMLFIIIMIVLVLVLILIVITLLLFCIRESFVCGFHISDVGPEANKNPFQSHLYWIRSNGRWKMTSLWWTDTRTGFEGGSIRCVFESRTQDTSPSRQRCQVSCSRSNATRTRLISWHRNELFNLRFDFSPKISALNFDMSFIFYFFRFQKWIIIFHYAGAQWPRWLLSRRPIWPLAESRRFRKEMRALSSGTSPNGSHREHKSQSTIIAESFLRWPSSLVLAIIAWDSTPDG